MREGMLGCGDMEIRAYDFERATRSVLRRHGSTTSALRQSYPRRVFLCARNTFPNVDMFSYRVLRGGMDMDLNQIVSFAVEA